MKNYFQFCPHCGLENLFKQEGCRNCGSSLYVNPAVCIGAVILNKAGNQILLTKRRHRPYKGWWDLPGGFVNLGENPDEALRRELKEELNLGVEIRELIGFYPDLYGNEKRPTLNIHFLVKFSSEKIKVGSDVVEARWFKIKNLPSRIAFKNSKKAIVDFLKRR